MNKQRVHTDKAPAAIGPYSQAICLGEMIYTSGQIPVEADGSIRENIIEQTHCCLKNLKAVLEAAGSGMDSVVKTTVFISDMDQFGEINKIYQQYFTEPYPARSCVQVARLPKNVGIEIEAIAFKHI